MGLVDNAKWKNNNNPVTTEELNQLIKDDRARLKIAEPVKAFTYAKKFISIPDINRYKNLIDDTIQTDNKYWYTNEWVVEIKSKGAANYIDFTGDYLADPTVLKPIKISVYPFAADGDISSRPVLIYYEYKAIQVKQKISLASLDPGYYTIIIEDPVKIFKLAFSQAVNFSMIMRPGRQINSTALFYSFIYVPEGIKKINVIKTGNLGLITPSGRKINFTDNKAEDVQVEVKKGEEGLWRVKPLYGKLFLEGIPPYLSTSPRQMLIPSGIK